MELFIGFLLLFTPAGFRVQTQDSPYASDRATTVFIRVLSLLCNALFLLFLISFLGLPGIGAYVVAGLIALKFSNQI